MAIIDINLGFVANAGGAVNVITATYDPAPVSLYDGLLLWFVATGANTSTTPTFNPNALGAKRIVKNGNNALVAGDIPGAKAVVNVAFSVSNDRWEIVGFIPSVVAGAGLTIINKAVDYTLVANDLALYDTDSGDRVATLPVTPPVNTRVGIYLQTLTGSNTVTTARGAATIGGVAAEKVFYVANDFLILRYDGAGDWIIETPGIQKHKTKLRRDAAQSIPNATLTKILYDAVEFDIGGISDLANSQFIPRRAGKYEIGHNGALTMSNDQRAFDMRIYVDTVLTRRTQQYSSTPAVGWTQNAKEVLELSVGAIVEIKWLQNANTVNTPTGFDQPLFSICEL